MAEDLTPLNDPEAQSLVQQANSRLQALGQQPTPAPTGSLRQQPKLSAGARASLSNDTATVFSNQCLELLHNPIKSLALMATIQNSTALMALIKFLVWQAMTQ